MTVEIVDTHQHLWDLSIHKLSWCASLPALNRSFVTADYLAAIAPIADQATVVKTLFMECDVDEADLEREVKWAIEIAKSKDTLTAAIVAGCRPDRKGFEAYLDRINDSHLRGVRRVLHSQPDDLCTGDLFVSNIRTLARRGLTYDLCVAARQLPSALELVRRCPDVSFVLDHCGVPDVKGRALDPWREDMRAMSQEPNVIACKVSGLVAYADPATWTPGDLRPFVDHVADCFGSQRILFGGDWPVCTLTCSLGNWINAAIELTQAWSHEERTALFRSNAERVYRI